LRGILNSPRSLNGQSGSVLRKRLGVRVLSRALGSLFIFYIKSMPKIKIDKKHIWTGVAALGSAYFSIVAAFGIILGYIVTRLFVRKYLDTGRIKSVIFSLGYWRIHLHHWIMGALALVAIPIIGSFHECPKILLGLIGGVIADDFEDAYKPVLGLFKKKDKI
jgi:hypothetical protein